MQQRRLPLRLSVSTGYRDRPSDARTEDPGHGLGASTAGGTGAGACAVGDEHAALAADGGLGGFRFGPVFEGQGDAVPVGLRGTEQILPVGASRPRLAKVAVSFGPPIYPESYAGMPAGRARRELTDDVMDAIALLSGQERADTYNEVPTLDPS